MIPDNLGETRTPQKDGPTKADLKKLMEQCRANRAACEDTKQLGTRVVDWLPIKSTFNQTTIAMLIVTCAIIIRQGKILICQRSSTMHLPLKWEFPGGKVEPGEDEAATVVREIREELHLNIEVVKRLKPVEHDYPKFRIRLVPFIANVVGGELRLEEHAAAKWVTVDELDRYDWAPADVPIVGQLKAMDI